MYVNSYNIRGISAEDDRQSWERKEVHANLNRTND